MKRTLLAQQRNARSGMILFAVMAILSGLAIISSTMFVITKADVKIVGNFRESVKSFYNADAGIAYVKAQIEAALAAGTLTLSNATETISVTAPSDYNFDPVTQITRIGNGPAYSVTVKGRGTNAQTTIVATFRRRPAMNMGVFGDSVVDMKANGRTYSYYSNITPTPTPADSTGEADTGSNEDFITHVGTFLDGDLVLGADSSGTQGVWADPGGGATITGEEGQRVPRVTPDPLGAAAGGELAATFTTVASVNNNASAVPAIPATKTITLNAGETMTLTAGNYSVSKIELKNSANLVIDASAGPVNIYLTGEADFKNGSTVNVIGSPANFSLFSNSSQNILIYNSSTFKGLIYAPFASVTVNHAGDFYGLVWAKQATIRNSGDVYIDLTLMNSKLSKKIELLSWKETRS